MPDALAIISPVENPHSLEKPSNISTVVKKAKELGDKVKEKDLKEFLIENGAI